MPGTRKLGRTTAHRNAMLRGMVTLLLENGQVETTLTRAKEVRSIAEKMITLGKKNTLASRRAALAFITKEEVVTKVFVELAPLYAGRNGGYTQIYKLGPRRGDGAEMAIVKLIDYVKPSADDKKAKKEKTSNSFEFTSFWADANNRIIPDLIDFTKTFFAKHTILNILTRYCVFTAEKLLLVMRPYQIVATERIINRIEIAHNYKKFGRVSGGGYIWHTTGSGKTLQSKTVFYQCSKYRDVYIKAQEDLIL